MKNKYIKEISTSIVLVVLLACLVNPFNMYMLSMFESFILGLVFVLFALFASLFLREKAEDEREEIHRSLAGRAAFIVGSIAILVGIAVQVQTGKLDTWLVVTLVSMVLAKIIARIYSENKF